VLQFQPVEGNGKIKRNQFQKRKSPFKQSWNGLPNL